MKTIKLNNILNVIKKYKIINYKNILINGIAESSNDVQKGNIFICIKGSSYDGHNFINEAIKKGAAAVIALKEVKVPGNIPLIIVKDTKETLFKITDYYYSDVKKNIKIYGITGTKGKTTVSYMIGDIIKKGIKKDVTIIGTIAYKIGNKIYESKNTTPSNLTIHKLIAESARKNIKNIIMEVSSHALDQERIKNINFDVAIITNVTRDHFDYHHDYKNYLKAKLKIVNNLKKGGTLVVNIDDKSSQYFIEKAKSKKAKIVTYSINKDSDIKIFKSDINIKRMLAQIKIKNKIYNIKSKLIGEHNLHNIMASIGASYNFINMKKIINVLNKFKGVKGRMEVIYNKDFLVIVDYAHNADSLKETLITLNKIKKGKIITLFGAGGNRDKGKRPIMGAVAERFSDVLIVTSDNPRFEEPMEIIKDILIGTKGNVKIFAIKNRRQAIYKAIKIAEKKDIVLLAGKGHEVYQEIKGKKYPFEDGKIALRAIKELK